MTPELGRGKLRGLVEGGRGSVTFRLSVRYVFSLPVILGATSADHTAHVSLRRSRIIDGQPLDRLDPCLVHLQAVTVDIVQVITLNIT